MVDWSRPVRVTWRTLVIFVVVVFGVPQLLRAASLDSLISALLVALLGCPAFAVAGMLWEHAAERREQAEK